MDKETSGFRLKRLRISKGYSQEQLAEKSNLSLRTVQRIESDETIPRGDTLTRLANTLDVSITDFMDRGPITTSSSISANNYLALINLLGLTMCLYYLPLVSIIAPGVAWLIKRDTMPDVYQDGKKIMNFQFTWTTIFFLCYYGFFIFKIQHWPFASTLFQFAIGAMVFNVISVLVNTVNILNHKPVKYILSMKFLK